MNNLLLTRQSIFNADLNVVGYELLSGYEDEQQNAFTRQTHVEQLSEFGFERLTNNRLGFIQCSGLDNIVAVNKLLPSDHTVIELSPHSISDSAILALLGDLHKKGFQVAFCEAPKHNLETHYQQLKSIYERADFIKVNIHQQENGDLTEHVSHLKKFDAKLLADSVDSYADLYTAKMLGFDYFQGHFYSAPRILKNDDISVNRTVILRVLSQLNKPNVTPDEIDEIISQDPKLSLKLIKLINSAAFGLRRSIGSIKEAVIYLGLNRIRSWASMVSLSSIKEKPHELLRLTLARAKMCESIGRAAGLERPETCFMVGLFSTLDALLDQPLLTLLKDTQIEEDIKLAIIYQTNEIGSILHSTIAYENASWDELDCQYIDPVFYRDTYLTSLEWAEECISALH